MWGQELGAPGSQACQNLELAEQPWGRGWGRGGRGGPCSPVGSPQTTLQLPGVYIPDVKGSVPGTCQRIASVRAAGATAEQAGDDQR